jgi:hypothetical protein
MMESTYIAREVDDDIDAPDTHRLTVREALESIRTKYYKMEELAATLPEGKKVMQ